MNNMLEAKKSVGIFRFDLCLPSETFIIEQARHLSRYEHFFFGREIKGPQWTNEKIVTADRFGGLCAKLFSVYPNKVFFSELHLLKEASIFHSHFGPDSVYALDIATALDKPLVSTFHGFDVLQDRRLLAAKAGFRFQRYLKNEPLLQARGNGFIAVSKYIQDALVRVGYPEEKVIQHYIGVDTERFSPSPAEKTYNGRPYILSVARHVEFKGIHTLLRAFKKVLLKCPDMLLVQVGAGPLFDKNIMLAKELGIKDNVCFLGVQNHEVVRELMQRALCFCGPSETASDGSGEALGIVFCEASACETPVVSTYNGGIPEVVVDGETGRLAPEKEPDALAIALLDIVTDANFRDSVAKNARKRMIEKFNLTTQSLALEDIYDRIVEGKL